jgi:TolB protein
LCAGIASAQDPTVRIESQGRVDSRIPIAVPTFATEDATLMAVAEEMAAAIAYDLEFSGLFTILPRNDYPPNFRGMDPNVTRLDRNAWRATKAEHLVYALIRLEGDELVSQFRLFDLFSKEQVVGKELRVQRNHYRLSAHRFSEEIIRNLDGVAGIATSEICFSAGKTGQKEIFVADYDGINPRQVTHHNSISIKPKISPDGRHIAYLSYKDRYCYLYIFDRTTGKSTPLSREIGLNSAPAWAPDGKQLALTLSKDGNTEIYLRNADGSDLRRLTKNRYGDTSPSFSPDGKHIVYVSEQGGSPQIYVMTVDGKDARRLSYQGGNGYDPVWSPDGKYIAYVVEKGGQGLEIYVVDADGANPRRITDAHGTSESPSWSADSRHIIYMSNRSGRPQLWTANLESGEERPILRLDMYTEGPTWGPRQK